MPLQNSRVSTERIFLLLLLAWKRTWRNERKEGSFCFGCFQDLQQRELELHKERERSIHQAEASTVINGKQRGLWMMRKPLLKHFGLTFVNSAPGMNSVAHHCKQQEEQFIYIHEYRWYMNLLKHKSKAARFKFEDNFLTTVKAIRGRELDVSREIGRLQASTALQHQSNHREDRFLIAKIHTPVDVWYITDMYLRPWHVNWLKSRYVITKLEKS